MFLAWNFLLKLYLLKYITFRGAGRSLTSDRVMSPNISYSAVPVTFKLKDKSPVYHLFSKAGCLLKVVAYMKGKAGSLKAQYYPITSHVPNLAFFDRKLRIQN